MRVLVTGADGFVGKAVVPELLARGFEVRALRRAEHGELSAATDWSRFLDGVETIIHLAARAHRKSGSLPLYRAINTDMPIALANAAARAGVENFVFVSTAKVLGESGRFDANSAPNPPDAYSQSKAEAEQALSRIGEMRVAILRPPLMYGPGVKANFLRLMQLASLGVPLPFASLKNERSLLYVRNLADAAIHSIGKRGTYLVADDELLTVAELVRRLGRALGKRPLLVPFPRFALRLAAPQLTETFVVKTSLDWKPPFSVEEGLAETTTWFSRASHRR